MYNFKNFFNTVANNNRIFSREDIRNMSTDDFIASEKAIDFQLQKLGGIPYHSEIYNSNDATYQDGQFKSKMSDTPTGFAANFDIREKIKPDPRIEYTLHQVGNFTNNKSNKNRPLAHKFMDIGLNIEKHKDTSNSQYTYIDPQFTKQFYEKNNINMRDEVKNWPGIIFNKDSDMSKAVSNSKNFQEQVKSQYNPQTGKFNSDKINIDFSKDYSGHSDLRYTVGHGTVINPKMKDGYIEGQLFDEEDFAWMKYKNGNNGDLFTTSVNNGAKLLQDMKIFKNYYNLTPFKFKY